MSLVPSLPVPSVPPAAVPRPGFRSFDEVRQEVEARAGLDLPDAKVPLSSLRATPEGAIEVPGQGALALTEWSQTVLARMLGVRWETWFRPGVITPEERAAEINMRLSRMTPTVRVRARRHPPGGAGPFEGKLRAIVSATYEVLDDAWIFGRIAEVLGSRTEGIRFASAHVTDRFSFFSAVTPGEHDLGRGRKDPHHGGITIRNSEVGAGSVGILGRILRLVCLNGLLLPGFGPLLHRAHRQGAGSGFGDAVQAAFLALPDEVGAGVMMLREARATPVADPKLELAAQLMADRDLKRFLPSILAAYDREPEPSRFGMIQAVTLAAQDAAPEARHMLEAFAGRLLPRAAS